MGVTFISPVVNTCVFVCVCLSMLACACYLIAQLCSINKASQGGGATKNILLACCPGKMLSTKRFFSPHVAATMVSDELGGFT